MFSVVSYLRTYPMTSGGRRGAITDLLTTSRHPFRSFDTLRDSAVRRQVQSLILSSHRFLWPPSVVYVYLDHLKFCVVCIDGRRYVCCSECNVVSNECNEPTSCLVQPIGSHCCEVMYFRCFSFMGELGFLNCDDICMCVVYKQFELLEFVFDSVMLTCSMMRFLSLLLLGLCVVSVVMWSSLVCLSLSWYPMWMRWLL